MAVVKVPFQARDKNMNIFDGPYIRHNKWFLIYYGLWPYQPKFQKLAIFVFFGILAWSLMIPMIAGLSDETSTSIVIRLETIVTTIVAFGGFAQVTSLFIRRLQLKTLYDNINSDWQSLTNTNELKILHKYSGEGKRLIFLYARSTCGCYFLFIVLTYASLLDNNEKMYRNDNSKFYPYYCNRWIISNSLRNLQVSIHTSLIFFYCCVVYIVVIATYICCIKHFCGMYAILRYKLKRIINVEKAVSLIKLNDDEDILSKLFEIIEKHKNIIRGIRLLMRIFHITFFIIEVCVLACLASVIFDVKYHMQQIRLLLRILFLAIILIIHVFYINYGGEQIMQFSNEIYVTTHHIQWYLLSVKAQKILLMIIQRTAKPENLKAGLMIMSFENFAWTIKASWSLATVIFTTQKKR